VALLENLKREQEDAEEELSKLHTSFAINEQVIKTVETHIARMNRNIKKQQSQTERLREAIAIDKSAADQTAEASFRCGLDLVPGTTESSCVIT
jgi:uncharacterized coiled-coil protein SlyX